MLLKYNTGAQKRIKSTGIGKPQRTVGGMVRLGHGVSGLVTVVPKIHRRVVKAAGKRPASLHHRPSVKRGQIPIECDNSNDSGLGFDQHLPNSAAHHTPALIITDNQRVWPLEESPPQSKRRRLEIKLESDDAIDNYTYPVALRRPQHAPLACVRVRAPITLSSQLPLCSTRSGAQLVIACQPETQHRARYQTEGSRGAVKDRTGNGFPVVKLVGYDRPATLQVFIGTDQGRVAPHMFYQACRVSGKNSTPCIERKIDGTIVIEVDLEPSKDMVVTCDCVGILKERNVDVEHRFPEEGSSRSKKKSTRCRMVFRTMLTLPDGTQETLQAASQPIVCTQPPGVPEVSKKSLSVSGASGGQELFILGKNFLKDTRVVFTDGDWRHSVAPDKEFLQQSHLVCVVPPYQQLDITQPVTVHLVVESSNKTSEPHSFVYLPEPPSAAATTNSTVGSPEAAVANISVISQGGSTAPYPPLLPPTDPPATYIQPLQSPGRGEEKGVPVPMGLWNAPLMPPPMRPLVITARRNSAHLIVPEPVEVTLDDVKLKCESSEPNLYLKMISDIPRIMIPPKPVFPGESTNLLTTVEGGRVPVGLPVQDNLGVIVNAAMIQTKAEPKDEASNMLPSMTERLDAFVNSAAESHISPTPTPAITENVLNHVTEMGLESTKMKMQESGLLLAPTLPVSHTSPGMDNGPICAMMDPPVSDQAQTQAVLECFNENVNSGELMSSPQLVTGNPPVFPDIHTLMGKQMPTLTVTCAPVNGPDMNGMMQSENQVQALSDIRDSLEQHLSPPVLSSGQMHPPQLNGLMQTSPHPQFQDLQTTIGQQMTAQSLNSSHTDINGMLRAQETPVEQAHLLNDIRVDLEQKFSPPINPNRINADLNLMTSPQIANHEQCLGNIQSTLVPQNLSAVSINHSELNDLIVSSSNVKTEVQDLSNMPTSFEQHLTNQMVQPTNLSLSDLASGLSGCGQQPAAVHMQALEHHLTEPVPTGHDTLNNGITLDTLNASPQMQVTVSQAHALSTLQAINDHISSQVITSPVAANQSQPLPDLQLSLGHLTSDPSEEVGQEHNLAVVSQSQMLSNLQASIDEHLEAQSTCAEAMLCTTAAVQMNTQQAPGQLSPIRHLSPQQTILPDPISLSSDSSASVILSPTNARHASPPEINPAPMMSQPLLPATDVGTGGDKQLSTEVKKGEPMPNITHLAQMSENDLISYINTSCFDSV